jgi:hypothetical protein
MFLHDPGMAQEMPTLHLHSWVWVAAAAGCWQNKKCPADCNCALVLARRTRELRDAFRGVVNPRLFLDFLLSPVESQFTELRSRTPWFHFHLWVISQVEATSIDGFPVLCFGRPNLSVLHTLTEDFCVGDVWTPFSLTLTLAKCWIRVAAFHPESGASSLGSSIWY